MTGQARRWVQPPEYATEFLQSLDLFEGLDPHTLEELACKIRWYSVRGGEVVFNVEDEPDGMHVVLTGRLRIEGERAQARYSRKDQELGPRSTFGEISYLTGQPRTATVVAVRDSVVGWIMPDEFEELFHIDTTFAMRLTRRLATWVTRRPARDPRTPIITIQAGWKGVNATAVAHRIAEQAPDHKNVEVISLADLEPVLGDGFAKRERLGDAAFNEWVHWLDSLEAATDAILLVADGSSTTWDSLCQRQSDRVVVVIPAGATEAPPRAHYRARARLTHLRPIPIDLLLWHRDEWRNITGTARWLRLLSPNRHYHLRSWLDEDSGRIARRLFGGTLSFVLSGGAARGFAHIGVMGALKRQGAWVDYLGGTSMGAVLGAQIAAGWSEQEQLERNLDLWNRYEPQRSYTIPWLSLVSRHAAEGMLDEMFESIRFEDLPIPCYATSTDLTNGQIVVHDRGRIARALRSSISIPGIGPPVPTAEGHLLADGAVLDNLPVRSMVERCNGHLVAVNVMPVIDPHIRSDYADIPTFLEWLDNRRSRSHRRFPHIVDIISRATMLPSIARAAEVQPEIDLLIEPKVAGFPLMDMKQVREISIQGAQSVRDREDEIREFLHGCTKS